MIQELDLPSTSPIITHFKQLFETRTFEPNRHNVVKITHNPGWFSCFRPIIVDKELPTYIKQVKEMMKDFESIDEAIVIMQYGITKNTIHCKKEIRKADSDEKKNVCVIYVDVECEGGELVFYNENKPFKTIKTTSCKVVMFEGSIYHKRNDYSNGHRLTIVFEFPKKVDFV